MFEGRVDSSDGERWTSGVYAPGSVGPGVTWITGVKGGPLSRMLNSPSTKTPATSDARRRGGQRDVERHTGPVSPTRSRKRLT